MADTLMISNVEDRPKKKVKRKRAWSAMTREDKESRIKEFNEEIKSLFRYYEEMITNQRLNMNLSDCGGSLNGMVAVLMEESELPLSKLVGDIHMKLKENEKLGATVASVKNAVLFLGQRVMYGVPNADADVLEDHTKISLWCWETRDVKLLPKSVRGRMKIRRTCRKKIHARITAISAMLTALQKSESDHNFINDLMKASEKLSKVLSEANIRMFMDSMLKKNSADMIEKDAKGEQKLIIKQLEKNKREVEKEKKRMDRELQKERLQSEKELKRLQEEAERDERHREKEESEMRKQLRKQQDEVEKDQRRQEKEEAELKKQLAIQKQASIMERFLKRSKTTTSCQNDRSLSRASTSNVLIKYDEKLPEAVTMLMDSALSSNKEISVDDLHKSHLFSWRRFGHFVRSNRNQHWGLRRKPKTELFKELKLNTSRGLGRDDDLSMQRLEDRWGEQTLGDRSCVAGADCSPAVKKCKRRKQLLQFAKSYRPAFYGIWPKKSHIVRPRQPLRKDPDLDYDIDSDEEWEEEDPGESLSDCDKDDDEEACSKADDEDESEDGFFVPDGYLSEDEGAQVDRMEIDLSVEETKSSSSCKLDLESEKPLHRQQKHLNNLTEHALRKNQPLIILNLMHEKVPLLMAEDLSGTSKMEQTCLQALSMQIFSGGLHVEITVDSMENEKEEACLSNGKSNATPISPMTTVSESDLPAIVYAIQSCSTSINKVVESLQQKFPAISKSQLRNKVKEISDFNFTENCWQVKKEILIKLGLSNSPEMSGGTAKGIAAFFSKRCLPLDGKSLNPDEISSSSSLKLGSAVRGEQGCTYNHL